MDGAHGSVVADGAFVGEVVSAVVREALGGDDESGLGWGSFGIGQDLDERGCLLGVDAEGGDIVAVWVCAGFVR